MNPEADTDQLLELAASGDGYATQQLLTRHRDRLRRMVAMRMDGRLAARFDPSDVVQEALITITRRLPDYLGALERISFYPWMRRITWEHLLKLTEFHLQTQKRSVDREIGQQMEINDDSMVVLVDRLASNFSSPSAGMLRAEVHHKIRRALTELKQRDREIIELIYLEQLDPSEVAEVLGVSRQAMSMRHIRAIKRFAELIDQSWENTW